MSEQTTVLLCGGTGRAEQHSVRLELKYEFRVRALARDAAKFGITDPSFELVQGSITNNPELDAAASFTTSTPPCFATTASPSLNSHSTPPATTNQKTAEPPSPGVQPFTMP